ncbi:hypothetical protein J8273_2268 [Carpediemonas membranifera]|uniref:Reverse transcriptase domain-containing protein n=1 Tax=Carpediemonas membranifera TaxID=201153 RepID=A0A8J6E158_9EUKA|nr:hypothetical protein J8273_2268 [Carpediemonas membranifera]|eukprot:KAG9395919.1 hypothetical protein J8273_2268 [Carpediemonas membranifera]
MLQTLITASYTYEAIDGTKHKFVSSDQFLDYLASETQPYLVRHRQAVSQSESEHKLAATEREVRILDDLIAEMLAAGYTNADVAEHRKNKIALLAQSSTLAAAVKTEGPAKLLDTTKRIEALTLQANNTLAYMRLVLHTHTQESLSHLRALPKVVVGTSSTIASALAYVAQYDRIAGLALVDEDRADSNVQRDLKQTLMNGLNFPNAVEADTSIRKYDRFYVTTATTIDHEETPGASKSKDATPHHQPQRQEKPHASRETKHKACDWHFTRGHSNADCEVLKQLTSDPSKITDKQVLIHLLRASEKHKTKHKEALRIRDERKLKELAQGTTLLMQSPQAPIATEIPPDCDDYLTLVEVEGKPIVADMDTGGKQLPFIIRKDAAQYLGIKQSKASPVVLNAIEGPTALEAQPSEPFRLRLIDPNYFPIPTTISITAHIVDTFPVACLLGKSLLRRTGMDFGPNAVTAEEPPHLHDVSNTSEMLNLFTPDETAVLPQVHDRVVGDIRAKFLLLLGTFAFIFGPLGKEPAKLPPYEIHIRESAVPVRTVRRLRSAAHTAAAAFYITQMITAGILATVTTDEGWLSPILMVPKPSADPPYRLCIDFRELNEATTAEWHRMPSPDELFEQVRGATHFAKFDLTSGFFQLSLADSSRKYTAFSHQGQTLQFTRLPFGVTNGPMVFQARMETLLKPIPHCLVFVDDILLYASSEEELLGQVESLFAALAEANIRLSPTKSIIGASEVEYLGFIVSGSGVRIDPKRLQGITDLPVPQSSKDAKHVVGVFSFIRQFIPNFVEKARPLQDLASKKHVSSDDASNSLSILKAAAANAVELAHFQPDKPVHVYTDASNVGIGASIIQDKGPIAFLQQEAL